MRHPDPLANFRRLLEFYPKGTSVGVSIDDIEWIVRQFDTAGGPTGWKPTAGLPQQAHDNEFHFEACSIEVWRWGRAIRVAIRSEESVGKAIEIELSEAQDLARRLTATINADKRPIRDEPQA